MIHPAERLLSREELNTILSDLRCSLEALYGDRLVRLVLFGPIPPKDVESR